MESPFYFVCLSLEQGGAPQVPTPAHSPVGLANPQLAGYSPVPSSPHFPLYTAAPAALFTSPIKRLLNFKFLLI